MVTTGGMEMEPEIRDEGTLESLMEAPGDIWPMSKEETLGFTKFGQCDGANGNLVITAVGTDEVVEVPIHDEYLMKSGCLERVLNQTCFAQTENPVVCLPDPAYLPYIQWLLRFLHVPNSYDLDMATFRRPLEDCMDLCLCADYLQIPEPWWGMFYLHMGAKFGGRGEQLAQEAVWSRFVLMPPVHLDGWLHVLDLSPQALETVLRAYYQVGPRGVEGGPPALDPPSELLFKPPEGDCGLPPPVSQPEVDADQRALDILRRLAREAPRNAALEAAVQFRLDAMVKRSKHPRDTPACHDHARAFQAGWPRGNLAGLGDALVWNLITAQLPLKSVACLQVVCTGFNGRLRFMIGYWLQQVSPVHLQQVLALSHALPPGVGGVRHLSWHQRRHLLAPGSHHAMGRRPAPPVPAAAAPVDTSEDEAELRVEARVYERLGMPRKGVLALRLIGLVVARPPARVGPDGPEDYAPEFTVPRAVRRVLGGSPLEHLDDPPALLACARQRLAWARLADSAEQAPGPHSEVAADRAVVEALEQRAAEAERGSEVGPPPDAQSLYADGLGSQHPARPLYAAR